MRHVPLVAILCAVGLAGCGVSDDEAEVREVTERFYAAVRDEDGDSACERLSAEARTALEGQSGQACEAVIARLEYGMGSSDFWNRTLQNWQSEFLAVGTMAIFTVYLRQRGSSQSKPVGAPHHATAEEG